MMVAASTLQSQPEKHLSRMVLGRHLMQLIVATLPVPIDRRRSPPRHSPDAATIPRTNSSYSRFRAISHTSCETRRPPGPNRPDSSSVEIAAPAAEERRIVGRIEQSVDGWRTFVRRAVRQERLGPLGAGSRPQRSSVSRRARNMASSAVGEGISPSFFHFSPPWIDVL